MKSTKRIFLKISALLILGFPAFAQTKPAAKELLKMQTWQLLDYQKDTVYGMSVNRAYNELLKGKKSHPVIVTVIDGGVDIIHADLQRHIWTNKKEIVGNGIDDDKNGYADDVNGWNFTGGKDGKMMDAVSSEADREYARLLPAYGNINDSSQAPDKKEYQYFLNAKKEHLQDSTARTPARLLIISGFLDQLISANSILQKAIKKPFIYFKDVEPFQPKDSLSNATKKFLLGFYDRALPVAKSISLDSIVSGSREFLNQVKSEQPMYEKLQNDPNELRKEIVGYNHFDINDRNYGNNIVGDKYADHGTHCSGIIAAVRNNGIGMDGITDNVLIMPIRIGGPLNYGDERDKDVALAIHYAIDNGAKIISMSFGKALSPQKKWVDDALKYAEKKGILLVHAAGNDGADSDSTAFYPNADFLGSSGRAKNMITVGPLLLIPGLHFPYLFQTMDKRM